jgi:hypothetical protein
MLENADVLSWELSPEQMGALDCLTTAESIEAFVALYRQCVVRDTPLADLPTPEAKVIDNPPDSGRRGWLAGWPAG